jgi:hypothetical protein
VVWLCFFGVETQAHVIKQGFVFFPPTQSSGPIADHANFDILLSTVSTQLDEIFVQGYFSASKFKVEFFAGMLCFYLANKMLDRIKVWPTL